MPRILDIGAFNAVREAGLAKLVPAVPRVAVGMGTCGRGNGAEGLYHAFAQAIESSGADLVLAPVGCFGACFQEPLVNVRLPGNPLVILRRVQANDAARVAARPQPTGNLSPDLIYCKIEEWDHITGHVRYGQGYPEVPSWNDVHLLQRAKEDRSAELRNHQSRRHRRIHRHRRISGALQGIDRCQPGGRDRADQGLEAARPRRRWISHRQQVGVPGQGEGRAEIHHLQCRRGRSRRLYESQRD